MLPQTTSHLLIPNLVKAEDEEEEEEAGEAWAIIDGDPTLLEEFEGLVNIFMAETANSEALEPQTLAEAVASCCPGCGYSRSGDELGSRECLRAPMF